MVIVARESDGRWYVTFTIDTSGPEPLPPSGRADFLHRASTRLVREHDVIVIEDLNVAGLIRNRHLARAISGCGWGARHDRDVNAAQNILAAGRAVAWEARAMPAELT